MYIEGDKHLDFDEEFLKTLIRPNDYFIDVGANIGSAMAEHTSPGFGPHWRVVSTAI